MVAAGDDRTVLFRSDGRLVVCQDLDDTGESAFPTLPPGVTFCGVALGFEHSALLCTDGNVVWCGLGKDGENHIPPLPPGVFYTQVSSGDNHTVLLRSDGTAVACGLNRYGQCEIPLLDGGMTYTQVSAAHHYTVLLRSDGVATVRGWRLYHDQQGSHHPILPEVDEGTIVEVSAGGGHTVVLCHDGHVFVSGAAAVAPALEDGVVYDQVSAGCFQHSVLLRSDGTAVAFGTNRYGQCDIPPLEEGVKYVQVSAGEHHTVLLRSDGTAVACGENERLQCIIPELEEGVRYVQNIVRPPAFVIQVFCYRDESRPLESQWCAYFRSLGGDI